MNIFNRYSYLLILLITVAGISLYLFLPSFETEEFDQEVIDNNLKIPMKSKLLKDISKKRIIIFTSKKNKKSENLIKLGCEIIFCKLNKNKKLNLKNIFSKIYSLKISDLLVEAGGICFAELLNYNLVDEIHLFKSKIII